MLFTYYYYLVVVISISLSQSDPITWVARLFCDRRKFDPTLVSIDVSVHRRLCGQRKCARDVCAADIKVDISANLLKVDVSAT